eukprot:scaffold50103_cov19-Tisochrysis_lutea.AAC.4
MKIGSKSIIGGDWHEELQVMNTSKESRLAGRLSWEEKKQAGTAVCPAHHVIGNAQSTQCCISSLLGGPHGVHLRKPECPLRSAHEGLMEYTV